MSARVSVAGPRQAQRQVNMFPVLEALFRQPVSRGCRASQPLAARKPEMAPKREIVNEG